MSSTTLRRHWRVRNSNAVLPEPTLSVFKPLSPQSRVSTDCVSLATTTSPASRLVPPLSKFDFPQDAASSCCITPTSATSTTDTLDLASPPVFDCDDAGVLFDENEGQQAIRPVQILTDRLKAWYALTKRMHEYFTNMATVEGQVAKAYERLDVPIFQPPPSNQPIAYVDHFTYADGVKKLCEGWQTYHSNAAKDHAHLASYLQTHATSMLASMKQELKSMIRCILTDDRLKLSTLAKLRQEAQRRILCLEQQLLFFEQHPHLGFKERDPWLVNAGVVKQILKVYHHTNKMQEAVLRLQKEVMISEQRWIQAFRQLCFQIHSICEQSAHGIDQGMATLMNLVESVKADGDWQDFVERFQHHLIPTNAAFRHPDRLQYPNHAHPLLQPVLAARMERNSSILHQWHEYMYVLTPAGFLHEYRSEKNYPGRPDNSFFIPRYNISTLSTNLHHNLIFQLQPQQNNAPFVDSSAASIASSSSSWTREPRKNRNKVQTLRAKSASDMQLWLEHLTEFSHRFRPSVSYHAPLILQPSNATNPDCFLIREEPSESLHSPDDPAEDVLPSSSDQPKSTEPPLPLVQPEPPVPSPLSDQAHPTQPDDTHKETSVFFPILTGCRVGSVDDIKPSAATQEDKPDTPLTAATSNAHDETPPADKPNDEPEQERRPFILTGVCCP